MTRTYTLAEILLCIGMITVLLIAMVEAVK